MIVIFANIFENKKKNFLLFIQKYLFLLLIVSKH